MVGQGTAFVFFAAVIPIEVIYAKETLDAGDAGYGLLLASWGAGMVIGSVIFATLRRASLPYLLLFSTVTVGLGYLGMAAAPALATACAAAMIGGAGNGVQWVAMVSAVQELTVESMQARVMSVLESIGAAMPGIGYLLGGLIATADNPRATFAFAGAGVLAIVAIVAPILGSKWPERLATSGSNQLDGGDDVVLELLPGASLGAGLSSPTRRYCLEKILRVLQRFSELQRSQASGLAACGDGDSRRSSGGGAGGDAASVTIAQASQPDFLDPALSYTIHGWEPMWTVYTPLLTYQREEGEAGSELMPGLAEEMPEISNGRQDLQTDPAQGTQILRWHAGQSERLRAHDQAGAQPRVAAAPPITR